MIVEWSYAAIEDLDDIYEHTAKQWGRHQAILYTRQIDTTIQGVIDHPKIGHVYRKLSVNFEYRSIRAGRHSIFYRLDPDVIRVVRIVHSRRDIDESMLLQGEDKAANK